MWRDEDKDTKTYHDKAGNFYVHIKGKGDDIMWSCHTDTVHHKSGRQLIRLKNNFVTLHKKAKTNCLGADDGAGIWLMYTMIEAKKPGFYVFHRDEEHGGTGSNFSSTNHGEWIKDDLKIKACIALDRKGYSSVITHQGTRTCSDKFAKSVALALDAPWYKPDSTGVFTDSANYTDVIGECTNLSVGYFSQHTDREMVDVGFLLALADKLIAFDPDKLEYERKPGEEDPADKWGSGRYSGGYYGSYGWDDLDYGGVHGYGRYDSASDKMIDLTKRSATTELHKHYGMHGGNKAAKVSQAVLDADKKRLEDHAKRIAEYSRSREDAKVETIFDREARIRDMIRSHETEVVEFIERNGLTEELAEAIFEMTGRVH